MQHYPEVWEAKVEQYWDRITTTTADEFNKKVSEVKVRTGPPASKCGVAYIDTVQYAFGEAKVRTGPPEWRSARTGPGLKPDLSHHAPRQAAALPA